MSATSAPTKHTHRSSDHVRSHPFRGLTPFRALIQRLARMIAFINQSNRRLHRAGAVIPTVERSASIPMATETMATESMATESMATESMATENSGQHSPE
ncbi:hypothetical protein [Rubripirellula obstinata]|uniref:hypothetical protein n=1 Tax=Rubripirellula obstinata TaxID=406547 RepID=UPI00122C4359|nr:hypothetical protein [Rubripirellula obstinata]